MAFIAECVRCKAEREPNRGNRGMCSPCTNYVRRRGELDKYPLTVRTRDEVLDAWEIYTRQNYTKAEIAKKLGMTYKALDQAITRARRDGEPRAIRRQRY